MGPGQISDGRRMEVAQQAHRLEVLQVARLSLVLYFKARVLFGLEDAEPCHWQLQNA